MVFQGTARVGLVRAVVALAVFVAASTCTSKCYQGDLAEYDMCIPQHLEVVDSEGSDDKVDVFVSNAGVQTLDAFLQECQEKREACNVEGCVTFDRGLLPVTGTPASFGNSVFRLWDRAIAHLPDNILKGNLESAFGNLEILDIDRICDKDEEIQELMTSDPVCIPQEYLPRAHGILSYLAAAYMYRDTTVFAEESMRAESPRLFLPDEISIPLNRVAVLSGRLNADEILERPRSNRSFSWHDMFTNNFIDEGYDSADETVVQWDTFKLAFRFTNLECERRFIGITVAPTQQFGRVIEDMSDGLKVIRTILVSQRASLLRGLLHQPENFRMLSKHFTRIADTVGGPSGMIAAFDDMNDENCDPVDWWNKVAVWAQAPYPDTGPNGLQFVPVLAMDVFFRRQLAASDLARSIEKNMAQLAPRHRRFIEVLKEEVNVPEFMDLVNKWIREYEQYEMSNSLDASGLVMLKEMRWCRESYNDAVNAHRRWLEKHLAKASYYISIGVKDGLPRATSGGTYHTGSGEPRNINHAGGGDVVETLGDAVYERADLASKMGEVANSNVMSTKQAKSPVDDDDDDDDDDDVDEGAEIAAAGNILRGVADAGADSDLAVEEGDDENYFSGICPVQREESASTLLSIIKQSLNERSFSRIHDVKAVQYQVTKVSNKLLHVELFVGKEALHDTIGLAKLVRLKPMLSHELYTDFLDEAKRLDAPRICNAQPDFLQAIVSRPNFSSRDRYSVLLSKRTLLRTVLSGQDIEIPLVNIATTMEHHPVRPDVLTALRTEIVDKCQGPKCDLCTMIAGTLVLSRGGNILRKLKELPDECLQEVDLASIVLPASARRFSIVDVDRVRGSISILMNPVKYTIEDETTYGSLSGMFLQQQKGILYVESSDLLENGPLAEKMIELSLQPKGDFRNKNVRTMIETWLRTHAGYRGTLPDSVKDELDEAWWKTRGHDEISSASTSIVAARELHLQDVFNLRATMVALLAVPRANVLSTIVNRALKITRSAADIIEAHTGCRMLTLSSHQCIAHALDVKIGTSRAIQVLHSLLRLVYHSVNALKTQAAYHWGWVFDNDAHQMTVFARLKDLWYDIPLSQQGGWDVIYAKENMKVAFDGLGAALQAHIATNVQAPRTKSLLKQLGKVDQGSALWKLQDLRHETDRAITSSLWLGGLRVIFSTAATWVVFYEGLHDSGEGVHYLLFILARKWSEIAFHDKLKKLMNRRNVAVVVVLSRPSMQDCKDAQKVVKSEEGNQVLTDGSGSQVFCQTRDGTKGSLRGRQYLTSIVNEMGVFDPLIRKEKFESLKQVSSEVVYGSPLGISGVGGRRKVQEDIWSSVGLVLSLELEFFIIGSTAFGENVRSMFIEGEIRHMTSAFGNPHDIALKKLSSMRKGNAWVEEIYDHFSKGSYDEDPSLPGYTCDDVASTRKSTSCVVTFSGSVYDITAYLSLHPGSDQALKVLCGGDITEAFFSVGHSSVGVGILNRYIIGKVEPPTPGNTSAEGRRKSLLTKFKCESISMLGRGRVYRGTATQYLPSLLMIGKEGYIYMTSFQGAEGNDFLIPLVREIPLQPGMINGGISLITHDDVVVEFHFDDSYRDSEIGKFTAVLEQCLMMSGDTSLKDDSFAFKYVFAKGETYPAPKMVWSDKVARRFIHRYPALDKGRRLKQCLIYDSAMETMPSRDMDTYDKYFVDCSQIRDVPQEYCEELVANVIISLMVDENVKSDSCPMDCGDNTMCEAICRMLAVELPRFKGVCSNLVGTVNGRPDIFMDCWKAYIGHMILLGRLAPPARYGGESPIVTKMKAHASWYKSYENQMLLCYLKVIPQVKRAFLFDWSTLWRSFTNKLLPEHLD